ncbi:hypothetical protein EDC01DRAFT_630775 [Geopyxis carbonaria]|nr:hypothetical protein EDC01DRAFT_630775 [Geopyxis carbonaria]
MDDSDTEMTINDLDVLTVHNKHSLVPGVTVTTRVNGTTVETRSHNTNKDVQGGDHHAEQKNQSGIVSLKRLRPDNDGEYSGRVPAYNITELTQYNLGNSLACSTWTPGPRPLDKLVKEWLHQRGDFNDNPLMEGRMKPDESYFLARMDYKQLQQMNATLRLEQAEIRATNASLLSQQAKIRSTSHDLTKEVGAAEQRLYQLKAELKAAENKQKLEEAD